MIPKIIHYCWFGNNPKSELIEKCIASWKKYCPDWEIIEWNESNVDINSIPYMKEAYENQKWAFVSDVARLIAVYENGGVYLDTDVELKYSLNHLIIKDSFFCFESEVNVASGLGFGAKKNHSYVKAMLDSYLELHFVQNGKIKMMPCPPINTAALLKMDDRIVINGETQIIDNNVILSSKDYSKFAFHYGTHTWNDGPVWKRRKEYKDTKLKRFLRSPEKRNFIEKKFGKKVLAIYIFVSYDLLEVGFWYYLKRLFHKLIKR